MESDLFGQPLSAPPEFSMISGKVKRDEVPKGHAARPGSGPAGETCGSCAHSVRLSYSKSFYKCWMARGLWSHTRRTDIRLKDPACRFWQQAAKGGENKNEHQEVMQALEGQQEGEAGAEEKVTRPPHPHTRLRRPRRP